MALDLVYSKKSAENKIKNKVVTNNDFRNFFNIIPKRI